MWFIYGSCFTFAKVWFSLRHCQSLHKCSPCQNDLTAHHFVPLHPHSLLTGGTNKKNNTGRLEPWGLTPHPFIYHFWQKRYPYRILFTDEWYPFQIPSRTLHPPYSFNCCKCTLFRFWINHKTRTFCWLFHSRKVHLFSLLTLITDRNDTFPYPLIYFKKWNPYSFIYSCTWSLKKPLLAQAEPPLMGY